MPDLKADAATSDHAADKQRARLAGWHSIEGRTFDSPAIAAQYQQRAQRFIDILDLKEPDRVPCLIMVAGFLTRYGGITFGDQFYNAEKATGATLKFVEDFRPEYMLMSGGAATGPAYDMIGYNAYKWPGSNLPDDVPFQYLEGEYMPASDYDALINNPEGYMLRHFMPRICDKLQGLKHLPNMFVPVEMLGVSFWLMQLGMPQVREALAALSAAVDHISEGMQKSMQLSRQLVGQYGSPALMGGITKAPFDIVADTLRGTHGALKDLYRNPDKLLEASDTLVPNAVHMGVGSGGPPGGPPFVFMPLHKGADGFMSFKQFAKFYWPSFQKVLQGIIDAGMVPLPFVEGTFDEARLEHIANSGLPAGRTCWLFDRSDLRIVKKHFSGFAAFGGNVPMSLFTAATPAEMDEHCKHLLADVAPGGGYFLATGAPIDDADPEVVRAFIRSAEKYGGY